MVLDENFREFIRLLNANGVKYLVVGGYAVAYPGYPRYTKDIDFWVWADSENTERQSVQKPRFLLIPKAVTRQQPSGKKQVEKNENAVVVAVSVCTTHRAVKVRKNGLFPPFQIQFPVF